MNANYLHDGTWRIDAAFVGAILLAGGGFYMGLIQPRQAQVDVLVAQRGELIAKQAEAADRNAKAHKLKDDQKKLETRLKGDQVELKRVEDELNGRLKAFSDILLDLKAHGMSITETAPGTPDRNLQHTAVPIRVAGHGNFPAFAEFLASVHTRFKDVAVKTFRMSWSLTEPDVAPGFEFNLVWFAAPGDGPARTPSPRPPAEPSGPRAEGSSTTGGAP